MKEIGLDALQSIVASKRIVICVGAGGVGKTTIAASIAVGAATSGRRVACLTIDPARRLADSLGIHSPKVQDELLDITDMVAADPAYSGNPSQLGTLSVGMLDSQRTFRDFVHQKASTPQKAEKILNNRLYRYVSGSLSGMQEYMALEKLCQLGADDMFDLVILDTPPTSNAIDFFTASTRMKEALDGPLVRAMRKIYGQSSKMGFDLLGRWTVSVLNILSRVTGTVLLDDIMGFVDAISDLFGDFSERASSTESILRGEEVSIVMVTTATKAAVDETRDFRIALEDLGFSVDGVLFNQVRWPRIAQHPPSDLDYLLVDRIAEYNRTWNEAHDEEMDLISHVAEVWQDLQRVYMVPLHPQGAGKIENLTNIGRSMRTYSP